MEDKVISESISGSMGDVLQLSNRSYSAGDILKICCRLSYRIRRLKNTGVILILVWNYLVLSVFYYLTLYPNMFCPTWHMYSIIWGLSLRLSLAGCLADVCLGQYKSIHWSILIICRSILKLINSKERNIGLISSECNTHDNKQHRGYVFVFSIMVALHKL